MSGGGGSAALKLLVATGLLLATPASGDDRVAGHWEGRIETPGQPLVVKVDLDISGGIWSGSIDIPVQGARGLPLEGIEISEDGARVSFRIRGVPGDPTFSGSFDGDAIEGRFTQGAADFGFRLSREAAAAPARPQEPKPPFPYEIEEVSFRSGPVTFAGTLTVPPGEGPFAAVLLISAFVVLLAGPGVPGAALLRRQNERIFEAAGIAGDRRQASLALLDTPVRHLDLGPGRGGAAP